MISNDMRDFLQSISEQTRNNTEILSGLDTIPISHQETYEEYQARTAAKKAAKEKELNDIKLGRKSIQFSDTAIESLRHDFLEPLNEKVKKAAEHQSDIIPSEAVIPGTNELKKLLNIEHEKLNIAETRISAAMLVDDHEELSNAVRDRDKTVETIQRYESDIEQLKQTTT